MQKILKNKGVLFIITLNFWSNAIFAEDDAGGIGNDPGAPLTPIDNLIPIMLLVAIAILFYVTSKRNNKVVSSKT